MSVYDLLQAILRYKKIVVTASLVLVVLVGVMTFKYEDGSIGWRASAKYDSSVQIAVVPPGVESLTTASDQSSERANAAVLYAALLGTDEAARFVGEANGYKLDEAVRAEADRNAALITASVFGPTPEQAKGAALSTFDYLEQKLQLPLRVADLPTPEEPTFVLDGPFQSAMFLTIDQSLSALPNNLFLEIDPEVDNPTTLPVALTAGQSVAARATLAPVMVFTLTLQDDERILDIIRVAPPTAQGIVTRLPELELSLGAGSIIAVVVDDEPSWEMDVSQIRVDWREPAGPLAEPPVAGEDVQIALLTPEPGFLNVGGRRGPIVLVAALIVGSVLILSAVIVADAWRRERERRVTTTEFGVDGSELSVTDGDVLEAAVIVADAFLQDRGERAADDEAPTPAEASSGSPWNYQIAQAESHPKRANEQDTEDRPQEAV